MSATLANAPVYYALVQMRFDAVASMAKFANDIQERLRLNGYPVFETDTIQSFSISFNGENNNSPILTQENQWYFTSQDRSSGFVLGHDYLTFHTTAYTSHYHFFEQMINGLRLLNEIVKIPSINRLGLRYLNAVIPAHNQKVEDYLDPGVQGINLGKDWIAGSSESVFPTEHGILVSKVYRAANSHLGFPADLQIKSIRMQDRFITGAPLRHAVIDIDHYSEAIIPPDEEIVNDTLNMLHNDTSDCFTRITTPLAFKYWS